MKKIKKLEKYGYLSENIIDVGISLLIYKIYGFEITIVVVLGLIMADIAMIMYKTHEK